MVLLVLCLCNNHPKGSHQYHYTTITDTAAQDGKQPRQDVWIGR